MITGGKGGLATALVTAFHGSEWEILSPGRDELDVASRASVDAFFENLEVDLLICAAGLTRDTLLAKMDEHAWDEVWRVNYEGAASSTAAVLPGMIERKSGHIVFLSSQSAIHPPMGQVAYASAKAALLDLTHTLAAAHGRSGIRVNTVLPGFMETKMTEGVSLDRKEKVLSQHVLGKLNTPAAVAKFIRFLEEEMPHTSGQIFQLDSRLS